jgi:quercetin dioxygenase-like cupin family protein
MNARLAMACCWSVLLAGVSGPLFSQHADVGICRPVSERKTEVGCWILAKGEVGVLSEPQVFWHLDVYQTRAAALAVKGARGTVVEALRKVWLLSIEPAGWRSAGAQRVAEIGPIPVHAGDAYSTQYMEAVFTPGMTTPVHRHGGPEIWYTASGETCLETPDGKVVGRAGGPPVIIPEGPPMHLTATGTEIRRSLVLILHGSSKPVTTMAHDWTPKGLCKQ